jgi:putative hydrolase of the HAD superfamily
MKPPLNISTLFLDIGGVLLTDGWGAASRQAAAETFDLDLQELEVRHHQVFGTYEVGGLSLGEYLDFVVFHRERPFDRALFRAFMLGQSRPLPGMIELIRGIRAKYGLKVLVVSNEGRELNAHRIHTFHLEGFVDAFVSSCFVHLRKPDPKIFKLALDLAQVPVQQVLYLENTLLFTQVAAGLGIRSLLHQDFASTGRELATLGLEQD